MQAIPECGFLIIKDNDTKEPDSSSPGIMGMNIAKQFRLAEFDTVLGGELDSVWREAFNRVQEVELVRKVSTARIAGKQRVHVPESSVATVYVRGLGSQTNSDSSMLFETGNTPLSGGLMAVSTVVLSNSHMFPVQVINFSHESVWLSLG